MVKNHMAINMPMSKKIYLTLMAVLLLKSSLVHSQNVTELTITGRITDSTCGDIVVNGGSPVNFSFVRAADLRLGQMSAPINFVISLLNCSIDLKNRATISFSAETVPGSNGKYIQLDSIANSATGIAIALKDSENREVVFNTGSESYNLNEGDVNLNFQAQLVPINAGGSGIQAGSIEAKATFVVQYN